MSQVWKAALILTSTIAVGIVGILVWKRKKRSYIQVGRINKLYFYPVKSLKAVEVSGGKCTKLGFEVNGITDRSFMLVRGDGVLLSQREAPRLVLLTPRIEGKTLIIVKPSGEELKVEIKNSFSSEDKIIQCRVHCDGIEGIDCGDEAASFFHSYLDMPDVRLVHHVPSLAERRYLQKNPFMSKLRSKYPAGFQDFASHHIVSQASIDDVNMKLQGHNISAFNFRPNILVDGCGAYEEDSWRFIKLNNGVQLIHMFMTTRCLMTTNDPETGILSNKEPLVTLRKYRIPKDPEIIKKMGSIPCLGVSCAVLKPGEIKVGDDIFADVGPQPEMVQKVNFEQNI